MDKEFKADFSVQFRVNQLERDLYNNIDAIKSLAVDSVLTSLKPYLEEKLDKFFEEWDNSEVKQVDELEGLAYNPDGTLRVA